MAATRYSKKVCPRCPTCGRKFMTKVRLALDRFLELVEVQPNGCWEWKGSLTTEGYGQFGDEFRVYASHRWAYENYIGPIPEGLVLDHTCHKRETCDGGNTCVHRRCVNPEHLEPVTTQENHRRGWGRIGRGCAANGAKQKAKTHCPQGHEYTPENTYVKNGRRHCRICMREAGRKYDREKRVR